MTTILIVPLVLFLLGGGGGDILVDAGNVRRRFGLACVVKPAQWG